VREESVRNTLLIIWSLIFTTAVTGQPKSKVPTAEANSAAKLIQIAYGPDLQAVKATAKIEDDLAMAMKLLQRAADWAHHPDVAEADRSDLIAIACRIAHQLASPHETGYQIAIEAASIMAIHAPEAAEEAAIAALDLSMKRYSKAIRKRGVTAEARATAKNEFLQSIEPLADELLDHRRPVAAELLYKRTMSVARQTRDVETGKRLTIKLAKIKEAKKSIAQLDAARRRVKTATDKKTAAAELARLLTVEEDDPRAARKYTFLLDPKTATMVKSAAADPATLDAKTVQALGDWYKGHALTSASSLSQRAMLNRSKTYYDLFLKLHEADDLNRLRGRMAHGLVAHKLSSLAPMASDSVREPLIRIVPRPRRIAVSEVDLAQAGKADLSKKLYGQIRSRAEGQTAAEQQAAIVDLVEEQGAGINSPWYYGTGDKSPRTPFGATFYSYGNATAFAYLLKNGANPNLKIDESYTPLITVIRGNYLRNRTQYITALIAHGADVNGKDTNGGAPLGHAAYRGRADIVKILMANGATPKHPLHIAAMLDDIVVVNDLIQSGIDVNDQSSSGHTALYHTIIKGNRSLGAFRLLMKAKADVNLGLKSKASPNPMEYAAAYLRGTQARVLRAAGAKSRYPLHDAASLGDAGMIAKLVAEGNEVDGRDYRGRTPLMRAALNRHLHNAATVKALIAAGADINAVSGEGKRAKTALDMAYYEGYSMHTRTAKSLLAVKGVKVRPGYIVESARQNDTEAVRLMIGLGISVNTKNAKGHRPLDYATYYKREAMIKLLKKNSAKAGKKIGS
jgi:ankyrin repeat protein